MLSNIAFADDKWRADIVAADGVKLVCTALENHVTAHGVLQEGCAALAAVRCGREEALPLARRLLERAEDDCTCAIQLDPGYHKARQRRGMTRHKRGKYALAIEDLERAVADDPANAELRRMLERRVEELRVQDAA